MNKRFEELCTPAKLYFVLAVVSCIIALFNGIKFMHVAVNLIIAFLWTAAYSRAVICLNQSRRVM